MLSWDEIVDIVVKSLDAQTIAKLRNRATPHGRSLEDAAREILQQVSPVPAQGLMPLRENRKNLLELATRRRALCQQVGLKHLGGVIAS